jgi:PAT family beta-lactamase induction signal transducer AmpG
MMGLSRSIFPALSGYIVMNWGWKSFYFFTTIATIPALILLLYLHKSYNLRRETGV